MLTPKVLQLILSKRDVKHQITYGALLLFFQQHKYFPQNINQLSSLSAMEDIAKALDINISDALTLIQQCLKDDYRIIRQFKQEIRLLFKFRGATATDQDNFVNHCKTVILPMAPRWDQALAEAYDYFKEHKIEPYSKKQLERLLMTVHRQFEADFFSKIEGILSLETRDALDALLVPQSTSSTPVITLIELKSTQVDLKIATIFTEIQKYKALRALNISKVIESFGSRKLFLKYYERVLAEPTSSLKGRKSTIRYAYLSIFCLIRQQQMTDTLNDLLLKLLKRVLSQAERAVDRALLLDNKRVKGKLGTLLTLAKQSIEYPEGVIKEIIYPQVPKDRLTEIVTDLGEDGQWYRNQVKAKALSLYAHNNRRVAWALMSVLEFDAEPRLSNLLKAINFLKKINNINAAKDAGILKDRLYAPALLKKVVPKYWLPFVTIKTNHLIKVKVNWNAFELALFERLETELPVKNIWLKNAYRYRNPVEDMPADFDDNEDYYFNLLGLPKNVENFITNLNQELDQELSELNRSIIANPMVVIKDRKKSGAIKITPSEPQQEPQNLKLLKQDISKLWPNLHLIDILKEAELRIGFTKCFESVATREVISEEVLRKRLLLCLFSLGSNTGLKRMSGIADTQESYHNLRYVKRRFINCQNIRLSIQKVINAIQAIRDPKIWGRSTTSCAADSKKMGVWDQNLLVEWHARYGGRGVMIYWHVDRKGLCIHSKLKTCSSSEVGAMIQGILHHDTLMDIEAISVDSHGQSSIGFAFSRLFGFDLLPRIKNINKQKLYCSSRKIKKTYTNLTDALAPDIIGWDKIRQYYKEVVRHAAALKTRTVEPDVLMKRLSADNKSNPVYQALIDIGKASRTIFLCRYLSCENLRIDINDALNVVERVNSIMGFIFYGRLGEISTNASSDQEISLLCLHLLQVCMVYINTLLIQTALSDPKWILILTIEDRRALSPLLYGHINPYGVLRLDMNTRLIIETHCYRDKAK